MIDILPADFVPAVDSEVRKAATLRWPRVLGALVVTAAAAASAVTAVLAGPADPRGEPATGTATVGLYLGLVAVIIAAAAFGAAGAGSEYRYHTMAVTALFTADRDRLVAAKLSVAAGFACAAAAAVELVGGACLFGLGRGKFGFSLQLIAVLGGGLLAAVCWAVIGVGLGLLLRSPTRAVAALLGWLVMIEPLGWLVANGLGLAGFATLLPGSATVSTVAIGFFPNSDILAPTPTAIVVLVLWTIGIGGAGWWLVRMRDF